MYLVNIMIRNLFSLFKCPIQSILENLYVLPQEVILQQFERKLHNDFILSKQENVFEMLIILDPEIPTLVLYLPQVTYRKSFLIQTALLCVRRFYNLHWNEAPQGCHT